MVSKKQAIWTAGLSAIGIGVVYFITAELAPQFFMSANAQEIFVGVVTMGAVFGIGYAGMRS